MNNAIYKVKSFCEKNADVMFCLCLLVFCYVFLFHQLGSYSLIDVDETRYAAIAREILQRNDWITMHLNSDIFYEKPPLYFWALASSYMLFGKVSEFAARFPIALISTFAVFYTYFFGKKIISKTFGLISALILLSSFQFLLLSKIAILDMFLASFIMASIYSGFLTYFCKESNQKYFWWAAYFFSALAVLAKGLPGVILPFGVLGFTFIVTGSLKKMFKPVNIIPGILIFFTVALPWHLLIFQQNGMDFFNDYIVKQHFSRFIDSKGLGRQAPFYFFIPVFLVGFIPWIFSFLTSLISNIKYVTKNNVLNAYSRIKELFSSNNSENNSKKLLIIMSCYFLLIFLFFSSSSTKLSTYILPIYPAAAILTGYYWYQYIVNDKNRKGIVVSTVIFSSLLLIAGIAALFIIPMLNSKGHVLISDQLKTFTIMMAISTALTNFMHLYSKKKVLLFVNHVLFMAGIIFISTNYVIPMILNGGENELISYAKYAKLNNNQLITFNYGVRSSTIFYYGKKVNIITDSDYKKLKSILIKDKNAVLITKTDNLEEMAKNTKYKLVTKGKKYSLLSKVEIK